MIDDQLRSLLVKAGVDPDGPVATSGDVDFLWFLALDCIDVADAGPKTPAMLRALRAAFAAGVESARSDYDSRD